MAKLPRFDTLKGMPTLRWGNRWTDAPTITTMERCPDCEGEGYVYQEVPGGRWNRSVGAWEPDETPVPCEACGGDPEVGYSRFRTGAGTGWVEVARCGICGLPNEESATDLGEGWCECDEDAIEQSVIEHGRFEGLLGELADLAYGFRNELGLRHNPTLHGLSWNRLHLYAAEHGSKVSYGSDYIAAEVIVKDGVGRSDVRVMLFGAKEEV